MLKVIFIGNAYHKKTQSHQFFTEILAQEFTVDYYAVHSEKKNPYLSPPIVDNIFYDVVIFWQVKPDKNLLKNIAYRKILFFPMYDACLNWYIEKWISLSSQNITFICFSKILYQQLSNYGFHVYYLQYFPKAINTITNWGNPNSCFHWFRRMTVRTSILQKLFPNIDTIHVHQAPDPDISCDDNDIPQENVTTSEWFDTTQELNHHILRYGLYLAPRIHEGIGMSFLEAMSMGRCVIAPNMPTMNEYIQHKVNGLLYDINNPQAFDVTIQDIMTIQKNTYAYMQAGSEQWQNDKSKLLDIVKNFSKNTIKPSKRYRFYVVLRVLTNPFKIKRLIQEYLKRI
jgi:hypothetical protein